MNIKIKPFLIILFILLTLPVYSHNEKINFLDGSNIYARILLFFFPISHHYETFFKIEDNKLNIEITIDKEKIMNEPSTPSYFESNIVFYIKNIPYKESRKKKLSVTIQCNQNFINKKVPFIIYKKKDILIIKGSLNDLYVKEITEKEYFKNRFKWRFPFYFDIRLQINDNLINAQKTNQ